MLKNSTTQDFFVTYARMNRFDTVHVNVFYHNLLSQLFVGKCFCFTEVHSYEICHERSTDKINFRKTCQNLSNEPKKTPKMMQLGMSYASTSKNTFSNLVFLSIKNVSVKTEKYFHINKQEHYEGWVKKIKVLSRYP